MSRRHLLPHLLAVAILGGACLPARAADGYAPVAQRTFTEKPRIEDYADYNAFLVDIMEYRRQKQRMADAEKIRKAETAAAAEALGFTLQDETLANVSGQNGMDDLRELYEIAAPESLEDALERAKKLPHPVYLEQERFGRTTASSFPMPQIDGADLSIGEVTGKLQDLELVNPDTFRDSGDEDNAARVMAKNPSNEDDQAEVKATDIGDAMYQPFYDMATRILSGSDGKHLWLPVFVDNEAGRTVIHKLEINVGFVSE